MCLTYNGKSCWQEEASRNKNDEILTNLFDKTGSLYSFDTDQIIRGSDQKY